MSRQLAEDDGIRATIQGGMVMICETKKTFESSTSTEVPTQNLAFGLFGRKLAKPQEPSAQSEDTSGKVELAA